MFLVGFACVALMAHGSTKVENKLEDDYKPLWDVYGEIDAAAAERYRAERLAQYHPTEVRTARAGLRPLSRAFLRNSLKTTDALCNEQSIPVDILLLQDATASLQEVIDVTSEKTLAEIDKEITPFYNVSFSLVTFRDKPIPDLGYSSDDCHTPGPRRVATANELHPAYHSLYAGGGRDIPENQYGALFAAIQSPKSIPWVRSKDSVKLVIMITDAPPHFEGDSAAAEHTNLLPFGNVYDESKAADFCTGRYYPSPANVKEVILNNKIYLAVVVPDTKHTFHLALRSWRWLVTFAGFPESHVYPAKESDFNWFESLRHTIATVIKEKCHSAIDDTVKPASTTKRPNYCHRKH